MDTRSRTARRWIFQRPVLLALASLPVFSMLGAAAARAQDAAAKGTTAAAGAVTVPAAGEPIRLRTKWTPGELLSYDMRLEGTMNMQASPNAAGNPFAGIPLDVEVKMTGATAMEALSVDDMGTARVVPRLNAMKLQATSFGQRADLSLEDGRFAFTFNGQQMGRADRNDRNGAFLSNPPFALEISDRGRITGAVPRDAKGHVKEPAATAAGAEANAPARPGGAPATPGLDWAKLAQSMIWRAIPTLWPTMPVKAGDTWKQDVTIPLPDPAAPNALVPQQLGHFDFVMRGLEEINGQRAARVSVKGGLEIDNKLSRAIADAARAEGAQVAPAAAQQAEAAAKAAAAKRKGDFETQLSKATQRIEGDLWVDPANGHIVRAEMSLDTQTSAKDVAREGTTPRAKAGDSFFDFTGTLQMQLKDRTLKPAA